MRILNSFVTARDFCVTLFIHPVLEEDRVTGNFMTNINHLSPNKGVINTGERNENRQKFDTENTI